MFEATNVSEAQGILKRISYDNLTVQERDAINNLVYNHLQIILKNFDSDFKAKDGICGQLDESISDSIRNNCEFNDVVNLTKCNPYSLAMKIKHLTIKKLFQSFKHYSGCEVYPIKSPLCSGSDAAGLMYYNTCAALDGRVEWTEHTDKYLEMRRELIVHCIENVRNLK
ncbi:hypothetical protein KNT64_gp004 [Pseudomonas phage PspYZU05]|uniref:Uncharacterized protein n=1 Tax=Pseudomonas phage PspYZU05 TaxID=1983556 RepID=A0A2U7N4Y1_9CAUD|nr:hypothetical protein KNT64_gp004 [Pseudomonas phage PspYZU05]ASD51956.1 hypothetical protein PspYZU05_04 [Pseudomonas phage PspYZU05]